MAQPPKQSATPPRLQPIPPPLTRILDVPSAPKIAKKIQKLEKDSEKSLHKLKQPFKKPFINAQKFSSNHHLFPLSRIGTFVKQSKEAHYAEVITGYANLDAEGKEEARNRFEKIQELKEGYCETRSDVDYPSYYDQVRFGDRGDDDLSDQEDNPSEEDLNESWDVFAFESRPET